MEFYLSALVGILIVFLFSKSKKLEVLGCLLIVLYLVTLVALRKNVGSDWLMYTWIYDSIRPFTMNFVFDYFEGSTKHEFLYVFFESIFVASGFEKPYLFFGFISLTSFLIMYKAMRNFGFTSLSLSFFIYFCFFFLSFHFNIIRHGIMVSFVWLAFSYITKKKMMKYMVIILIGSMFHISAIFFLPFYFILDKNISSKGIFFILITSFLIYWSSAFSFFLNKISFLIPGGSSILTSLQYYNSEYYDGDSSYGISLGMIIYVILVLALINIKKHIKKPNYKILHNSLLMAVCFAFIFNSLGVFVQRIVSVFYISLIFILPMITEVRAYRKIKPLLVLMVIIYGGLLFYGTVYVAKGDGSYQFLPYKTIFVN